MKRIGYGRAAMVLGALLLLDVAPAAAERGEDGTLKILLWQAPTTLNPHISNGDKDQLAARIVYEPLATVDAEGTLVPFLAAEIPSLANGGVAADGRSVTWKLKQDVKWADGEPFTAADVVFTYDFLSNPEVGAATAPSYQSVERVEAIDDHTIKIVFKDVSPAWGLPFVGPDGMILPRHIFEPYNGPNAQEAPANRLAVGTGPYQVARYDDEDFLIIGEDIVNTVKIVYGINPYFRDPDRPHFAQVELRGGGDTLVAAKAVFEDGAFDMAWNLQVEIKDLDALEALGRARLVVPPTGFTERILFNFTDPNRETADGERSSLQFPHPILSDIRVREALTLAIDRGAIGALYGRAGPITSNLLVSPETYVSPNTSWTYDLEKAAALLDEAGWTDSDGDGVRDKDGVPFHLVYQTSVNDVRQKTQEIVRSSMAEIEVEIEPKVIDASIYFGPPVESTNTTVHFYADLEMYARGNDNPEPDDYMRQWLCDEASQKANSWSGANYARYCNPAYDALYEQTRTELDPAKRQELFIAMNDLLIEDKALIVLVQRPVALGLGNDIVLGRGPTPWDPEVWDVADWSRRK